MSNLARETPASRVKASTRRCPRKGTPSHHDQSRPRFTARWNTRTCLNYAIVLDEVHLLRVLARAMTRMSTGISLAEPMRETAALRWTTGSRRDWAWDRRARPESGPGRRVIPAEPALGNEGEGIRSDASAYPVSEGRRSEDGPQAVRKGPFCGPTSPAQGDKRSTGGTRCDSARRKSP